MGVAKLEAAMKTRQMVIMIYSLSVGQFNLVRGVCSSLTPWRTYKSTQSSQKRDVDFSLPKKDRYTKKNLNFGGGGIELKNDVPWMQFLWDTAHDRSQQDVEVGRVVDVGLYLLVGS